MLFIDNKYTRWYYAIITNAQARTLPEETRKENHHIVPECFFINRKRKGPKGWLEGNPEDSANKVDLTIEEHFVCHWLLTKMTEGKALQKMHRAMLPFIKGNNQQHRSRMNSRIFAMVRENAAKAQTGELNHMYGKRGVDSPFYGKKRPAHVGEAVRAARLGKNSGELNPMWGKKMPRETCPHCQKSFAMGMYVRWHGDKCKHKRQ